MKACHWLYVALLEITIAKDITGLLYILYFTCSFLCSLVLAQSVVYLVHS